MYFWRHDRTNDRNFDSILGGRKGGLFYDVQNLGRIWNHPYTLAMAKEKADMKRMNDDDDEDDEAGSLKDFVVDE